MFTLKSGWVFNSDGQKLPRTQAFKALQDVQVERPCELYLIANQLEDMIKVGISHHPPIRKGQLEQQYPQLGKLKILQTVRFNSFDSASKAETSIHEFLETMERGPVLDTEWFKPLPHDTWLIRWMINEMPPRFIAHIFGELDLAYTDLLAEYKDNPEYIAEEVLLGYGSIVFAHFKHETGYSGDVGFKRRVS